MSVSLLQIEFSLTLLSETAGSIEHHDLLICTSFCLSRKRCLLCLYCIRDVRREQPVSWWNEMQSCDYEFEVREFVIHGLHIVFSLQRKLQALF